ncbi:MAG: hypothetical protein HFG35_09335 [Eubacterium sp.]|nr:hypothetical protein [Eubacterium sp.]
MITQFEFDGIKSSVFGLYLCSFSGSSTGAKPVGNEITINTVKAPKKNRFIRTGVTYETPLTFSFQVVKYNCWGENMEITPRELAKIMRWLVRKDYRYLRFDQTGWDNVFYNCTLKVQKYEIGGVIRGLEIEATCDAPWGYSERKEHTLNLNGVNACSIYNYSDEDGGILPDLVRIEVLGNYDLLCITNTFSTNQDKNKTKTINVKINNCKQGEIIELDRHKNICSSMVHDGLVNDFNHVFLELFSDFNQYENVITSNERCNVTIYIREIRKGVPV